MSDYSLVFPMLALVFLTFGVAVVLFRARIRSVREGHTPVSYFRVLSGSPEPEFLAKPTRHFINLFEMPVLFYVTAVMIYVTRQTTPWLVGCAWLYVALRYVHTWIHLGRNDVIARFSAYFGSFAVLVVMWVTLLVQLLREG